MGGGGSGLFCYSQKSTRCGDCECFGHKQQDGITIVAPFCHLWVQLCYREGEWGVSAPPLMDIGILYETQSSYSWHPL